MPQLTSYSAVSHLPNLSNNSHYFWDDFTVGVETTKPLKIQLLITFFFFFFFRNIKIAKFLKEKRLQQTQSFAKHCCCHAKELLCTVHRDYEIVR